MYHIRVVPKGLFGNVSWLCQILCRVWVALVLGCAEGVLQSTCLETLRTIVPLRRDCVELVWYYLNAFICRDSINTIKWVVEIKSSSMCFTKTHNLKRICKDRPLYEKRKKANPLGGFQEQVYLS